MRYPAVWSDTMFGWLTGRSKEIEAEAERLLAAHGESVYPLVMSYSRDMDLGEVEQRRWQRIRRAIERRLDIPAHVDTATRMAERDR